MVTCKTCGYLTLQNDDGSVGQATRFTRNTGTRRRDENPKVYANLFCWEHSESWPAEIPDLPQDRPRKPGTLVLQQISIEIVCPLWTKHLHGRTPKDHKDVALIEIFKAEQATERAEQRTRDEQRREEDKVWRQDVESGINRRHNETLGIQKHQNIWIRASIVIAIASAAFTTWTALSRSPTAPLPNQEIPAHQIIVAPVKPANVQLPAIAKPEPPQLPANP